MKIVKTITCHDVYNVGAGLQAYALAAYLNAHGCDAEILDYKPEYLSRHYRLNVVSNPRYDKPVLKQLYLLAKLSGRLKARKSRKKKEFDDFRAQYLKVTPKRFETLEELKEHCPPADVYIAGSDQIWNPLFPNGKDPAFFLDFVSEGKKVSYAASFSVDALPEEEKGGYRERLKNLELLSVRENSGVQILKELGFDGVQVCDPVFLLGKEEWEKLIPPKETEGRYVFVYDFDNAQMIAEITKDIAGEEKADVLSYFPRSYGTMSDESGPLRFLSNIMGAETVVSNSFHATAFSLIFHKEFFVVGRKEAINTRMIDLLDSLGLSDRYLSTVDDRKAAKAIDWSEVDRRLEEKIRFSEAFLKKALEM